MRRFGCEIHHWGDIDRHGFAILDELRSHHGRAASFLMDRKTLLAFRPLCGVEDTPTRRDLQWRTAPELGSTPTSRTTRSTHMCS